MKPLPYLAWLFLVPVVSPLFLSSCTPRSGRGGTGDGTYTPPPSLSPVDATDSMRSEYRGWR